MRGRNITWLREQLPLLVEEGVLDEASAERLRVKYPAPTAFSGARIAIIVCALFAALLIGAGMILLLAHNWEHLGRAARAAIAMTPLLAAQLLVGWGLFRHRNSTAWREGSAIMLALTIASAVALVDQTYHTGGDLESFLWRWALLLAPLPWLLNSSTVAIIFLASLTWWAGAARTDDIGTIWLWPLAMAVVPHLISVHRDSGLGLRATNLNWACAIFLPVAAGVGLAWRVPGLWILVYVGLFSLMTTVGMGVRHEGAGLWRRPFEVIGIGGSIVMWLILSFEDAWRSIGWNHIHSGPQFHQATSWVDLVLAVGLPVATVVVVALVLDRHRHPLALLWSAPVPAVALLWPLVAAANNNQRQWLAIPIVNFLIFGIGIGTVAIGIRGQRLGTVNLGMVVITALTVVRFFDSDIGFVAKGLAFIGIGVGFLVANLLILKHLRRTQRRGS